MQNIILIFQFVININNKILSVNRAGTILIKALQVTLDRSVGHKLFQQVLRMKVKQHATY